MNTLRSMEPVSGMKNVAGQDYIADREETAGDRINRAMRDAGDLCSTIEQLADRLCGSLPEEANGSGQSVGRDGELVRLDFVAGDLQGRIKGAYHAIDRIGRLI